MHSRCLHTEELLERRGQARYISTIDLSKGYWQIPMAGKDQQENTFGTLWGLFEFTKMLFGPHGAAATLQRLMDHILVLHTKYATAYIDDIVIYLQSWVQHTHHLKAVLNRLCQVGMMANKKKILSQYERNQLLRIQGQTRGNAISD